MKRIVGPYEAFFQVELRFINVAAEVEGQAIPDERSDLAMGLARGSAGWRL